MNNKIKANELIEQALHIAESIKFSEKYISMECVAKAQAKIGDENGAKETLQKTAKMQFGRKFNFYALFEIATVQAKIGDENGAKDTLQKTAKIQLERKFDSNNLFKIAKLQAKIGDKNGAKDTLNRTLLKCQSENENNFYLFNLMDDIASANLKVDDKCLRFIFDEELKKAEEESIDSHKSSTLSEIALYQAKMGDIHSARHTILKIEQIAIDMDECFHSIFLSKVLNNVAITQAKIGDVSEALRTVQNIQDCSLAWSAIIEVQAKSGNVQQALKNIKNISNSSDGKQAFLEIIKAHIKAGNIDEATQFLSQITTKIHRDPSLRVIVEAQIKMGKFDKAIINAQKITDDYSRNESLCVIVEAQTKTGEFDKAIINAQKITTKMHRDPSLRVIVEAQIKIGEFDKAIIDAQQITSGNYRNWSICYIVEAQAKSGKLDQAIINAQQITNDETLSHTLVNVACEQAISGNIIYALKYLEKVYIDADKVKLLATTAVYLLKYPYFSIDVNYPDSVLVGTSFTIDYLIRANEQVNISTRLSDDYEITQKPDSTICIKDEQILTLGIIYKKTGEFTISPLRISCDDKVGTPEIALIVTEELKIQTTIDYIDKIQEDNSLDIRFTVINNSEFVTAENIVIDFSEAQYEFLSDNYTIEIPRILPKEKRTVKKSLDPKFIGNISFKAKTLVNDNVVNNETINIEVTENTHLTTSSNVHILESQNIEKHTTGQNTEFNEIVIKRGYTHRGRFIRFKAKVENNSKYPIRDVEVHLTLPSTLRCESPKLPEYTIGDIESGEILACEFLLKPTACTTANVKGYVVYKDISGEIQTLTMRGKEIETCRPNLEQLPINYADVTETISSKLLYKDSEHIRLDGIGSVDARPLLLKTAQWMNMHHVEDNGHEDQLIFVGRQKVEQTMVIARAALRGDGVKVRCYVEREDLVAGFLAEFAENLEELITSSVKPSSDVIWRVMDLFEEIEDTLVYDPSKDQIFTYLNKAHEICRSVDKGISKEIAAFVDNVQLVKEHKDRLDDVDIVTLKQNIDSWNEVMRGKVD